MRFTSLDMFLTPRMWENLRRCETRQPAAPSGPRVQDEHSGSVPSQNLVRFLGRCPRLTAVADGEGFALRTVHMKILTPAQLWAFAPACPPMTWRPAAFVLAAGVAVLLLGQGVSGETLPEALVSLAILTLVLTSTGTPGPVLVERTTAFVGRHRSLGGGAVA